MLLPENLKKSPMENAGKILIVDDDKVILHIVSLIMESNGYSVSTDNTGSVQSIYLKELPDLILLDCKIGAKSGVDICSFLKRSSLTSEIPVILLSGEPNLQSLAETCHADDFLSKPFDADMLLEKVKQQLHRTEKPQLSS